MNRVEAKQEVYKTTSLNVASYIIASQKVKFIGLNKLNPKEIIFIFNNLLACQKLEDEYWKDQAQTNPKKLFYAFNELRDMMFGHKQGGTNV